jgi:hypothetical protein
MSTFLATLCIASSFSQSRKNLRGNLLTPEGRRRVARPCVVVTRRSAPYSLCGLACEAAASKRVSALKGDVESGGSVHPVVIRCRETKGEGATDPRNAACRLNVWRLVPSLGR